MSGRLLHVMVRPQTPGARGLPKHPVASAMLTSAGVEGDFNVYRHDLKQDDPRMAILVYPVETLQELDREGWPVRPGDLGENLTTEGIPYSRWEPPCRFTVGPALLEVTKPCTPCDNLFLLPYVGAERGAAFLKSLTGRRGWYARVLREGRVRPGDPVVLER